MKQFAYEYALSLQPELAPLRDVFDALELGTKCKMSPPAPREAKLPSFAAPADALFVDYGKGADSNSGAEASPLKTLAAAVPKARATDGKTIVLRAGVHFLGSTLALTAADSGLTIQNYAEEDASVSGGTLLSGLQWEKHNVSDVAGGPNVWVAVVPDAIPLTAVTGLNALSPLSRMTRARFPNRDPTAGTIEKGWVNSPDDVWTKATPWPAAAQTLTVLTPNATASHAAGDGDGPNAGLPGTGVDGAYFTYGLARKDDASSACSRYSPSGGYLCSNASSGGGFAWDNMVRPSGCHCRACPQSASGDASS